MTPSFWRCSRRDRALSAARAIAALVAVLAACSSGDGQGAGTTTTTSSVAAESTTTSEPSIWPELPAEGTPGAIVTANGIVLPRGDDGSVLTACSATATIEGEPLRGAHVVLDPGHGGEEVGAVGPTGLLEKDVNLAVAQEAKRILEATGATVVLTRTADYRITLLARATIAVRLRPIALVSIHHNAVGAPVGRPGNEVYHQRSSAESRRLAGLLFEQVTDAFDDNTLVWHGSDAIGAGARLNPSGEDYFGILRLSAGVPAVLSEAAYISNPPEEALLRTEAFRRVEAQAIADAIIRYVTTDDPGSGFVEPRTLPIRPGGGGSAGCEEPAY